MIEEFTLQRARKLSNNKIQEYDFIIAGSGCSGLSLLHRILNSQTLKNSKILVIDKAPKTENDRTWCFWEKQPGPFESIVYHSWNTLIYKSEEINNQFNLEDYTYKMIRGIDFYQYIESQASNLTNVEFLHEKIESISSFSDFAELTTKSKTCRARYIFNSTNLYYPELSSQNTLLQHFKGWEIETETDSFDDSVGTLMDFSVGQENGDTFMYVLPTSSEKALIEYTLFTTEVLEQHQYNEALEDYISNVLNIKKYTIRQEEYGIIPMTTVKFSTHPQGLKRVINLGTVGGHTKASSGYTFKFVQDHCDKVITKLKEDKSPIIKPSFRDRMFSWYDRTLLDVMLSKKLSGKFIFNQLFSKTDPEQLLGFLGNKSTLWQELKIMWAVPIVTFLQSSIKRIKK